MSAARLITVMRRDWRLFWPLMTIVGAWQILQRAVAEPDPGGVSNISVLFSTATRDPLRYLPLAAAALTVLAIATLIILIVQEDDIPGVRGDWLTRPVKRMETLAAKALVIAGAVLIPDFIAGVIYALVQDAPIDLALLHAIGRVVGDLVGLVLPLFLLASMSSSVAEAAILVLLAAGANYMVGPNSLLSVGGTAAPGDAVWVTDIVRLLLILVVAAPLVLWQYRRPNRWFIRGIAAVGVIAWIALAYVPQPDLARINVAFSPDPSAGVSVELPLDAPIDPLILARVPPCPIGRDCFPRFALPPPQGIAQGSRVILNASWIRVFDSSGTALESYPIGNSAAPFGFTLFPTADPAQRGRLLAVNAGLLSGQYHIVGDLTLTLLEPGKRVSLPIDGKFHFIRELGSCRARASDDAPLAAVDVKCRAIGTAPNQMSVYMDGARPPRPCAVNTSAWCPLLAAPLWARLIIQQRPITAYLDGAGGELPKSLDIQTYQARAHIARIVPLKVLAPAVGGLPARPPLPASPVPSPSKPPGDGR